MGSPDDTPVLNLPPVASYFDGIRFALAAIPHDEIKKATQAIYKAKENNKFVWIFGNGGSSATASHFANDLLKTGGVKAIALTDLTPTFTAYSNDDGYGSALQLMLSKLFSPGDVVVGFSCSGNSVNVVKAMPIGLSSFGKRIAFTGPNCESRLFQSQPDILIQAEHSDIRVQEDVHMICAHIIAGLIADGNKV